MEIGSAKRKKLWIHFQISYIHIPISYGLFIHTYSAKYSKLLDGILLEEKFRSDGCAELKEDENEKIIIITCNEIKRTY